MALLSFGAVQAFLTKVMDDNHEMGTMARAPHRDFWNSLTYEEFTEGLMPHLKIPLPILVKGNSAASNLILSLRGEGPLFDPKTGKIGPMPLHGTRFTEVQIRELANWIDAGCPK
jgi:hypothetical protein